MNYCLTYNCGGVGSAEEIRVPLNQIGLVFPKYATKRFIIELDPSSFSFTEQEERQFNLIKQANCEYTLACKNFNQLQRVLPHHPAFLDLPCQTWEDLNYLTSLKVSDIWISGPLLFQVNQLRRARCGIKFRFSPTNDPVLPGARTPQSFYVIPKDLSFYSALDTIDFKEPDRDRELALYNIYSGKSSPTLMLSDLVPSLPVVPIAAFKDYGKNRANCQQACKTPGNYCTFCDATIRVAAHMDKLLKN